IDQDQATYGLATMNQLLSRFVASPRFYTFLLILFAVLALILALVGVYGLMAYSVAERTNELGIRMALGARPRDVMRLVVRQGLQLILFGLAVGLAGSYALTRLIKSLL